MMMLTTIMTKMTITVLISLTILTNDCGNDG